MESEILKVDSSGPADAEAIDRSAFRPTGADVRKIAVVVTGMHRSGTSALTRILNLLGCDSARTLMPADRFNERGYWESHDISALNDEILASAGSAWNDWELFNPDWYASPKAAEFGERALDVLDRQFGSSRLFVVKDPRFCRLIPFWRDAFTAFGAKPMVVSPIREPAEVAASLLKRNGTNPSISQLLWLRHVLDAEYDTRGVPRAFVDYGELLTDWRSAIASIGQALPELVWPRFSTTTTMEIDGFLAPTLRHHTAAEAKAGTAPEFSPWIKETMAIMERWTRGDQRDGDTDALDRIRRAFDGAASTFARPISEQNAHGASLVATIDELRQTVAEKMAEVADRHADIAAKMAELVDTKTQMGAIDTSLKAQIRALDASVEEKERAMRALAAQNDRAMQALAAQKDAEIARLAAESAARHRLFDESVRSLRLRNEEFEDVISRLQAIESSTTWQYSGALRRRLAGRQGLARFLRRGLGLLRRVLRPFSIRTTP